jgi:methionine-rich copper-binding protein CopC
MMRITARALAVAAIFAAAPAFAHAFLQTASPKVGSSIVAPPREVSITFSEAVEPSFSTITVSGPPGFGGAGPAQRMAEGRTLVAPLHGPIPPGVYVVRWRVLAVDSHVTQGTFRFELKR